MTRINRITCLLFCALLILAATTVIEPSHAAEPKRQRRVLYNFDGDSCFTTKANSKGPVPITAADVRKLVDEVAYEGSQVDTILLCVNAQVMYYPTKIGTLRGTNSTAAQRAAWPASEKQRFENMQTFFDAGEDPYAILLAAARERGIETLLTYRVNDDHGNDFLRTKFRDDHPECHLGQGALDFAQPEVREYQAKLIEEAVRRYDSDGIELDFNRFPTFFKSGNTEERVVMMNSLVERVRIMLNEVGRERNKKLDLGVRVPSNYGKTLPTPESALALGCDVVGWTKQGWIDYVAVSDFLFQPPVLPLKPWKEVIKDVPVYGGIECTEGGSKDKYLTAEKYQRAAQGLLADEADGIYLFNFFTTREYGADAWEPPFEVLKTLYAPGASKP